MAECCTFCDFHQAERLQQSEEKMYGERQTRLSLAESNLRQLVARMEEEEAQTAQHSRCGC